jgi:hypothetical protein
LNQSDILVPRAGRSELGHLRFEGSAIATEHPGARELVAYWEARRTQNGLAPRSAIRPSDIKELLPSLFIAEPINREWRYRLTGTGITEQVGVEFTGKHVREVFDLESAMSMSWLYTVVADNRQPISRKGRFAGPDIEHAMAETVHLPMLARNGRTVLVLGGVFFAKPASVRWLRPVPDEK